ncbi:centromere protein C [Tiliqua scincoides]|uniref:centromere protein C n=1 Tax=Tiliqua scincoides TaxID=71010 RepID=UPI003462E03D
MDSLVRDPGALRALLHRGAACVLRVPGENEGRGSVGSGRGAARGSVFMRGKSAPRAEAVGRRPGRPEPCPGCSPRHTRLGSLSDWEKEKQSPDKINCVKAAFNTLATSSLSDLKDRSSDEDISVSLGSPALLLEEVKSSGHTELTPPDPNTIIPKKKSETLESLTTTTRSSTKECVGKLQLTTWKSLSPQTRNTITVESDNECEFFIEESFGAPSTSWISVPQKNKQAEKKSLTVSSETKKATKLQSMKRKDKRASNKLVNPQTKMKLDVSGRTLHELPDVARISERTTVVNDQSQLVCSIQQARKHACSEDKQSVDLEKEDDQEPTREDVHLEDQAALLEQDHSFSMESRVTIATTQQSSFDKPVKKQRSPIISQSKKQLEMERSNVKSSVRTKRRKNRVLVSEESSESEHGEQQYDEQTKKPYEQRLTDLRKTPSLRGLKGTQTFLISSEDHDGIVFHKQDSPEQYIAKKTLIASSEQQNITTNSLQPSGATDASRNSGSGPVWDHKHRKTSKCENSFKTENSASDLTAPPNCEPNPLGTTRFHPDESVDLEENSEVFDTNSLKYKMVMPTNTPNVRRTKRIRLKPLEYWRGERVNYKTRPSGGFVIGGIISPEQRQPRKCKKKIKPAMESENIPDDNMVSIKDPSQPAAVFDPVSKQEILLECVSSGSSHLLFVTNEALSIYKYLTTPSFSVGKIILKPLKEKGSQYSHSDTLVFHIIHGKLLLTLYDQCYSLAAGDYFYIPAGNIYNIRNLLNKECVIVFTQLKGNRLEEK